MENKIHYRVGSKSDFIGVEVLPEKGDLEYVVIDHIKFHEKLKVQGSEKTEVWVAYFKKNPYFDKPMILNSSNRKRLSKQFKSPYLEDCKDFPVRLTAEECRDPQGDGTTMGLRFSKIPARPPQKEKLTTAHPNYKKCVAHLQAGGKLSDLESKYDISPVKTDLEKCMSQGR